MKYIDESQSYVLGNSSVVKIYIIRPKPGPVAINATPRPFRLGIEPASSGLLDQCSTTGLGVAFFATGPGLGLIMYIFTTLKKHVTHLFILTFTATYNAHINF